MPARLFAGTSGFSYPSWKPDFYPAKLPSKKFLSHYATRLNSVESNYTFRRLPAPSTLESWIADTPETFQFAVKAHQRITHFDKLATGDFVDVFFKAIDPLRIQGRLGPVLFQLPPSEKIDVEKLKTFLATAPGDIRLAFEFRNQSWFTPEVYAVLRDKNAALCLAESDRLETPPEITADFVYFRLRKPDYSLEERAEIAAHIARLREQEKDVYVFFKHEDTPAGALYAEQLLTLQGR
jgi:uncharacterized protein YecE (DUF72 family)